MKKTILTMIVSLIFVVLVAACGSSNQQDTNQNANTNQNAENETQSSGIEPMTIRISSSVQEDHSMHQGALKMKEVIEERTNGVVKVEVYSGQQLGSLQETAEAVQLGSLEMTTNTVSTLGSFASALQVMEYPYLWPTDIDQLWQIVDGHVGEKLLESVEKEGFKGLGFWGGGFKAITNNGKPILTPDDMKGLNIRVIPSKTLISQYKAWGANPTPIDFGELYSALQQGTVDAQENPLETIDSMKFYEVQENLTILNHGYQFYIAVVNKNWFDNLSPEMQEIIIEAERAGREHSRKINEEKNAATIALLEQEGLTINILNEDQIEQFRQLSLPLHDELVETDEQREMLELIKAEIEKLQ